MQSPVPSTIAQVLFAPSSTLNYARIVAELEAVLTHLKPEALTTTWDCDDLVFFDLAETRIGLGYAEFEAAPIASCLTVSVGPRHRTAHGLDAGFDVLCSRIVERLQTRYQPVAVLWNQTAAEVSADLFDAMTEDLPVMEQALPPIDALLDPLWRTAQAAATAPALPQMIPESAPAKMPASVQGSVQGSVPASAPRSPFTPSARLLQHPLHQRPRVALAANNMAPAVLRHTAELTSTRAALYQDEDADVPMSTQMRLAVHCLNATLIMVWMPFGAAVMTYTLLKGEDMRLSGRIMALTGTFLALAHSPLGQSVAAAMAHS